MSALSDVLREAGRNYQNLHEGEYFDSTYFDVLAKAVIKHVTKIISDSQGDTDFLIWSLNNE